MNHTKSIRNTVFFIAIIILIIALGLYIYLYNGTTRQIENTLNARKVVSAAELSRSQAKDILALNSDTSASRARLPNYFVPANDAVSFIKAIEAIGRSTGAKVSISGIKATPPGTDSKDHIGQVNANVSAVGTWEEVMRTLELFEAVPYRSEMSHMSLSSSGVVASTDKEVVKTPEWHLSFDIVVSSL